MQEINRTYIMRKLATHIDAQSYLEIGVRCAHANFDKINVKNKVSVDPGFGKCAYDAMFKLTSDEFFRQNSEFFDIIFIDGLHESKQVEMDILNSLKCLNDGGFVVCHDMNPVKEYRQLKLKDFRNIIKEKNINDDVWNGDCWKAFVKLKIMRDDLEMYTVDSDFGCGVIKKGCQDLLPIGLSDLTYDKFDKNRKEWLGLISVDDLLEKF